MRWSIGNNSEWHMVPFAWIPVCFEDVVYWLEQPPWERRLKWSHVEDFYEYRPRQ